jgi:hypothetical protein
MGWDMFSLTLRDHLRVTFNQVVHRHKVHARAAQSNALWNRRLRGSEALLMGGAGIAAAAAAFGHGQIPAVIAAVLASLALVILLVHLTIDFETTAQAHARCSARLWDIRERYRSLLSDLNDGVLDVGEARRRRDKLMEELGAIYESIPITHLDASRQIPGAAGESDLPDEAVHALASGKA